MMMMILNPKPGGAIRCSQRRVGESGASVGPAICFWGVRNQWDNSGCGRQRWTHVAEDGGALQPEHQPLDKLARPHHAP
jgi:hypothetical protein